MNYDNIFQIEVTPLGKPRMTQRDRWAKRPCVQRYYEFKDTVNKAVRGNFDVNRLYKPHKVVFYIPMPRSWSKKKKKEMDWTPHRQKPDLDNLLKAFYDSILDDDSGVHHLEAEKIWSEEGYIDILY